MGGDRPDVGGVHKGGGVALCNACRMCPDENLTVCRALACACMCACVCYFDGLLNALAALIRCLFCCVCFCVCVYWHWACFVLFDDPTDGDSGIRILSCARLSRNIVCVCVCVRVFPWSVALI